METSLFDDMIKNNNEFDVFFETNIDSFESMSNIFDLNRLSSSTAYSSNAELLFDQSNSNELTPSSVSSPSSDASSSSPVSSNSESSSSLQSNLFENFNFLDEEQQAILTLNASQPSGNIEPISFVLPETIENGMKITNEIILNFDSASDEKKQLEEYEMLSKLDVNEYLNVVTCTSSDTCIDLHDNGSMSGVEDDDDDDDEDEPESSDNKNKKNRVMFIISKYGKLI